MDQTIEVSAPVNETKAADDAIDSTVSSSSSTSCLSDESWLSPDCRSRIFKFLSLKDCLQLTIASRASLAIMLPELENRRRVQFRYRHTVQNALNLHLFSTQSLRPTKTVVSPKDCRQESPMSARNDDDGIFLHPIENILGDKDYICLIPSVEERLQGLFQALPTGHPLNDDLRELILDLQGDEKSAEDLIQKLQAVTKAHRLHAVLLRRCTVLLDSIDLTNTAQTMNQTSASRNNNTAPNVLTVSLARYLGDVLSASSLMSHSEGLGCIVEGGPSLKTWIDHLHALERGRLLKHSKSWYQMFVYLHSAMLRIMPMTLSQRETLRITPSGVVATIPPEQIEPGSEEESYVINFSCFHSLMDSEFCRWLRLKYENDNGDFSFGRMTARLNDFGPLGPAFRGRDRRIQRVLSARSSCDAISQCFIFSRSDKLIPFVLMASKENRDLSTFVDLVSKCQESQPMTVLPPSVTFDTITPQSITY